MGCCITALVIGSSADRGSWARAPAYQPPDANTTARTARTDTCLRYCMIASDVGSARRTLTAGDRGWGAYPEAAEHDGPLTGAQVVSANVESSWTARCRPAVDPARASSDPYRSSHRGAPRAFRTGL